MQKVIVLASVLYFSLMGRAQAEVIRYVGPHPMVSSHIRGMCFIEGPHIHDYRPHKPILYVRQGDEWAFVGDPTEFERESPRYAYYGHHPVFWADPYGGGPRVEVSPICYISGPHYHWYQPRPNLQFAMKGDAYFYVGPQLPGYRRHWRRHSPMDDYYASVEIVRPVITVTPPAGYIGVYAGPYRRGFHGHGHVEGGIYAPAPRVEVNVPVPSLEIMIGGGTHHHYVGGAPVYRGDDHDDDHYTKRKRKHMDRGGPPPHAAAWGRRGHKGKGHGK